MCGCVRVCTHVELKIKIGTNRGREKLSDGEQQEFLEEVIVLIYNTRYQQLHADLVKNNLMSSSVSAAEGLKVLDSNKDGKISFNEFMSYMNSIQN